MLGKSYLANLSFVLVLFLFFFFFSSRRRHTRSLCDWSSDVCSSDLAGTTAYSAYAPRMLAYTTRSPTFGSVTPAPTALTTPAASCPRVNGVAILRSEERRVGKECRSRWWP